MKIYRLTNSQKILGAAILAITAGVSFLLALPMSEAERQMAASENVIVTREVKLQLPINTNQITSEDAKPAQQKAAVQSAVKSAPQVTPSSSWKMGDIKSSTPKIPLSEKISSYAIVELEQHPATLPVAGQQIVLPMLNGQKVIANIESVITNPNGDYSWSGHMDGHGTDYPIVMTYGENSIFATITTPEGSYSMESLDGLGWLYKNPAEIELSAPGAKDFLEVDAIE